MAIGDSQSGDARRISRDDGEPEPDRRVEVVPEAVAEVQKPHPLGILVEAVVDEVTDAAHEQAQVLVRGAGVVEHGARSRVAEAVGVEVPGP